LDEFLQDMSGRQDSGLGLKVRWYIKVFFDDFVQDIWSLMKLLMNFSSRAGPCCSKPSSRSACPYSFHGYTQKFVVGSVVSYVHSFQISYL
jgi:hypothetical protein